MVGICVLEMISWNALQAKQLCKYYKMTFFGWRSAVVHPCLSATSTKPALTRCILGRSNGKTAAALQAFTCVTDMSRRSAWVSLYCTNVLVSSTILYCTVYCTHRLRAGLGRVADI